MVASQLLQFNEMCARVDAPEKLLNLMWDCTEKLPTDRPSALNVSLIVVNNVVLYFNSHFFQRLLTNLNKF